MLVLTRKVKEEILIGNDIKVTLIRCHGNTVRIGIEAPRDVRIVRGELKPFSQKGDSVEEHESELSDREQAFAHPVSVAQRGENLPENNRIKSHTQPDAGNRLPQSPQIFVGSVGRAGNEPQLARAPLAQFVAAN